MPVDRQTTSYYLPYDQLVLPLVEAPPGRCISEDALRSLLPPRSSVGKDWSVSTHVFPAAYPRSVTDVSPEYRIDAAAKRNMKTVQQFLHQLEDRRKRARINTEHDHDLPQCYIAVNRYLPKRIKAGKTGKTLVLGHALGFSKETFEPVIDRLCLDDSFSEIWSLDIVNHGDSALLNKGRLPSLCDYTDMARDLAQFILVYLPKQGETNLPFMLQKHTDAPVDLMRLSPTYTTHHSTWRQHDLTCLGHSCSGALLSRAAAFIPSIVHNIILIDPVISYLPGLKGEFFVLSVLVKPESFASREEAISIWSQDKRVYSGFPPEAIQTLADYALVRNSSGRFEWKTEVAQEMLSYFEDPSTDFKCVGMCRAFHSLRTMPQHVKVHILRMSDQHTIFCRGSTTQEIRERLPNISVQQHDKPHLVVQTDPSWTAAAIQSCLAGLHKL